MRKILAAAAVPLLAAVGLVAGGTPSSAVLMGWGVVTTGVGATDVSGTGQATGDETTGTCSYTGTSVSTTGRTSAATSKHLYVSVDCTVLIGGSWYGASASSSRTGLYTNATHGNSTVPAGARPSMVCLNLTARWDAHVFTHSRCAPAGAYGWFDTLEVAVPFDQG